MEDEETIAFGSQFDDEWRSGFVGGAGESNRSRRQTCWDGCERPSNACICSHLPSDPIPTTTQILIVHHPHELRHKLSTVPVLARCLLNCTTVPGRRLRLGSSPILDSLYHLRTTTTATKALFLFPNTDPSSPSIDLAQWAAETSPSSDLTGGVVLVVFDGTWKHAKEMVTASLPFLSLFATCVSLGECDVLVDGESIYESELVLRKEPFRGCLSTMEAVARSLSILEPDGCGVEIEGRLLGVLRAMVRLQAIHLKPMKPRPRLMRNKKGTKKEMGEDGK